MKKVNALVLGLAVLLAFGCGKEEDPVPGQQNPVQRKCQLLKSTDDGITTEYFYNNAGRVVRITYALANPADNYHQEITYNTDGNTAEVMWFDSADKEFKKNAYTYNADKLPERISKFNINTSGTLISNGYTIYDYNSSKKLIKASFYQQPNILHSYKEYTYPAQSQIVRKDYMPNASGLIQLVWTSVNQYGTMKHPIGLLGYLQMNVLLTDYAITSTATTNHISGVSSSTSSTYTANADGYVTDMQSVSSVPGFGNYFTWAYNCQ